MQKLKNNADMEEKIEDVVDKQTKEFIINLQIMQKKLYKKYVRNNKLCEAIEKYTNKNENIVNTPHDKITRIILTEKNEVANLINKQLNLNKMTSIKADEIEEYKTSFITSDYHNRAADIVYKSLKYEGVYFLIEHQTKIDYSMPVRIAEYQVEIMRSVLHNIKINNRKYIIPTIFVIIVYNGKTKWNAKQYLQECQAKIPGIEIEALGTYKVMDASQYTDAELFKEKGILPKILIVERKEELEDVKEYCEKIAETNLTWEEMELFNRYVYTILGNKFGQLEVKDILEKINNKKEGNTMLEDVLDRAIKKERREGKREGKSEGKREGRLEGILENRKYMIIQMIKNNLSDTLIKSISGVKDKELEKIKKEMQ